MNGPRSIRTQPQPGGFASRVPALAALAATFLVWTGCAHFRPPTAEDKSNRKAEVEKEKMEMKEGIGSELIKDGLSRFKDMD